MDFQKALEHFRASLEVGRQEQKRYSGVPEIDVMIQVKLSTLETLNSLLPPAYRLHEGGTPFPEVLMVGDRMTWCVEKLEQMISAHIVPVTITNICLDDNGITKTVTMSLY